MSRPWMPLYVADYLGDTGHLSTVEHGAYLLLIMHYWQAGSLPDDNGKLARICRLHADEWAAIRETIAEFFDDDWRHGRIESEMAKASEIISKRSAAGAKGASSRWGKKSTGKTRSELLTVARNMATHTPEEWQTMLDVFGGCVRCGIENKYLHNGKCVKDHIIPLYQGGDDGIENIQPMCRNCNSSKGADTTDYRESVFSDWRERLSSGLAKRVAKLVANGCETSAQPHPPSPKVKPPKEESNRIEYGSGLVVVELDDYPRYARSSGGDK